MMGNSSGYMRDVDELVAQTSAAQVLGHFGQQLPEKSSGEHRMPCVFSEKCQAGPYGQLTVRLDDAAKRIFCHTCRVRGNLLTLIHGLSIQQPPTTGVLRGEEFKAAVAVLREIASRTTAAVETVIAKSETLPRKPVANTPLLRHEKDGARNIANLFEDLITDVAEMRPEAAGYLRGRPWLTENLMKKWNVGWIPGNGRSLFRKNYLVYSHRNERGEIVSYSGRDLLYEQKWAKWLRRRKEEDSKPGKHRFVQGFHRGVELYGGQATRLTEPYVRESLHSFGVIVVEGMNEVLRCESVQLAAVGLTSNRPTETQVEKLVRFAQQAGDNRIVLLPDCDEEGEAGFRELLWQLTEHNISVRLGCSRTMFNGQFAGRQPEQFSDEEWELIKRHLRTEKPNQKTSNMEF